jgi:S1-C subfamily serine protease
MNTRAANLLLTSAALLVFPGCLQSTSKERRASFSAYGDTKIGQEATTNFLLSRTAFLITGVHLALTLSATEPGVFNYSVANKKIEFGSAAAVDRRGYFLTAAHCVGNEPLYLVFGRGSELRAERASIVWRGNSSKKEPDLAVLCVPHTIGHVFEWATNYKVGDQVIAVGPNYNHQPDFKVVCFSGSILECLKSSATKAGEISISHSAPGHKGDSGGPLVDRDGRLLAINVAGGRWFTLSHPVGRKATYATHPDLVWLYRVIDEHAAAQSKTLNQKSNEAASGSGGSPPLLQTESAQPALPEQKL